MPRFVVLFGCITDAVVAVGENPSMLIKPNFSDITTNFSLFYRRGILGHSDGHDMGLQRRVIIVLQTLVSSFHKNCPSATTLHVRSKRNKTSIAVRRLPGNGKI